MARCDGGYRDHVIRIEGVAQSHDESQRDCRQHRSPPRRSTITPVNCARERPEPRAGCLRAEMIWIAVMAAIVTDGYISRCVPADSEPEPPGLFVRIA